MALLTTTAAHPNSFFPLVAMLMVHQQLRKGSTAMLAMYTMLPQLF
jgi:hypothetical protein